MRALPIPGRCGVRQPRAGRIPESGTLQQVAAHARIAKRRKQVNVALHSDSAIAFRRCLHFGGGVVPGQRGQFVDHGIGPNPSDGGLDRSGIQCVGEDGFRANFLQRGCGIGRSREREYLLPVRSQATNQRPADRTARTGDQNSHRTSLFSSLCGDSRAFRCSVLS